MAMIGRACVRAASLVLMLLTAVGCASGISKSENFSQTDKRAMIVFGVDSKVGGYALGFMPFDPATQKNTKPWSPNYQYDRTLENPTGLQFTASVWDPGIYAVGHFCYQSTCINFRQGTYYFELAPGKINYIGNFQLNDFSARLLPYTDDLVAAYLKTFPGVDAEIVRPELKRSGFKGLWD